VSYIIHSSSSYALPRAFSTRSGLQAP
jgi:hypothetical protein